LEAAGLAGLLYPAFDPQHPLQVGTGGFLGGNPFLLGQGGDSKSMISILFIPQFVNNLGLSLLTNAWRYVKTYRDV
jgi:hypothetical protein